MHRRHSTPASGREDQADDASSVWSACVEGYLFLVINLGGRGALDLVPLRDADGVLLACTPQECATGGDLPYYRVKHGRLVKRAF
jgi:hypothetical protein